MLFKQTKRKLKKVVHPWISPSLSNTILGLLHLGTSRAKEDMPRPNSIATCLCSQVLVAHTI